MRRKEFTAFMGIFYLVCTPRAAAKTDGNSALDQCSDQTTAERHIVGLNGLYNLEVLYVMDPNGGTCYERVYIDDFAYANLLPWVRGLKDELTRTPDNPDGEDLKVPCNYDPCPRFRELVDSALESGAPYVTLPSNLVLMRQMAMVKTKLDGDALPDSCAGHPRNCPSLTHACVPPFNIATARYGASSGSLSDLHTKYLRCQASLDGVASITENTAAHDAKSDASTSAWLVLQRLRSFIFPASNDQPHIAWSTANDSFQVTCPEFELAIARIKVTHVHTFWSAVKRSKHYGKLLAGGVAYNETEWPPALSADLSNTVIMLARSLTQMYGLGGSYTSHADASVAVSAFLDLSGALTLPRLEEFDFQQDKVRLYRLYRRYYDEDPVHRVPPIPSAIIPAIPARQVLKYLKLKQWTSGGHPEDIRVMPGFLEVISRSLWEGMRRLERDVSNFRERDVLHRIRYGSMEEVEGGSGLEEIRHYYLKREYSESSWSVKPFKFPVSALMLGEQSDDVINGLKYRGAEPWLIRPRADPELQDALDETSKQCLEDGARGSGCWDPKGDPPVTMVPYLTVIAQWVSEESCGHGFLLQPHIKDFSLSEYRAYMVGGAAARGLENDTQVVYTPLVEGRWRNVTLPHGYFWNEIIRPGLRPRLACGFEARIVLGTPEHDREHQGEGLSSWASSPPRPYAWPEMHGALVNAALHATTAVSSYDGGFLRTLSKVFARMDVIMVSYNADEDEPAEEQSARKSRVLVQPFVNEIEARPFSAGIFLTYWKETFSVHNTSLDPSNLEASGMTQSWGYRFAESILRGCINAVLDRAARV